MPSQSDGWFGHAPATVAPSAQAEAWIALVVARMMAEPGARAVLLGGSRARGWAWPRSDVDLLAIVDEGPGRQDIFDIDWLAFDTRPTTIAELEAAMAADGVTCDACLELVTLTGDPAYEARIEAAARRLYARHVPGPDELRELRDKVRATVGRIRGATSDTHPVALAGVGGDLVWQAAKICLSTVGIGPLREVGWHDALRAADLPFDAATPYARWFVGGGLKERLAAALALAELVLGEPVERIPPTVAPSPATPPPVHRPIPGPAEAVELHRQILYGFGKHGKAVWGGDAVRRALESYTIVWFAVPACLALAGVAAPAPGWWRAAPGEVALPFDAAALYAHWATGASPEER